MRLLKRNSCSPSVRRVLADQKQPTTLEQDQKMLLYPLVERAAMRSSPLG